MLHIAITRKEQSAVFINISSKKLEKKENGNKLIKCRLIKFRTHREEAVYSWGYAISSIRSAIN